MRRCSFVTTLFNSFVLPSHAVHTMHTYKSTIAAHLIKARFIISNCIIWKSFLVVSVEHVQYIAVIGKMNNNGINHLICITALLEDDQCMAVSLCHYFYVCLYSTMMGLPRTFWSRRFQWSHHMKLADNILFILFTDAIEPCWYMVFISWKFLIKS